jgi:hypothetical protein
MDLFQQDLRIDDDTVSDQALLSRMQDPGRDQVADGLLTIDNEGVAGVVSALVSDHDISLRCKEVHHLPFALVSPLGSDYDHVRHNWTPVLPLGAYTKRLKVPADGRTPGGN